MAGLDTEVNYQWNPIVGNMSDTGVQRIGCGRERAMCHFICF